MIIILGWDCSSIPSMNTITIAYIRMFDNKRNIWFLKFIFFYSGANIRRLLICSLVNPYNISWNYFYDTYIDSITYNLLWFKLMDDMINEIHEHLVYTNFNDSQMSFYMCFLQLGSEWGGAPSELPSCENHSICSMSKKISRYD